MNFRNIIFFLLLFGFAMLRGFFDVSAWGVETRVVSPNSLVCAEFQTDAAGGPTLTLFYREKPVLLPSPLGLIFVDAPQFGPMEILEAETKSLDETWENRFGRNRVVRDRANETLFTLRETAEPHRTLTVAVRAYDEGLAFRYILPEQKNGERAEFILADERTEFLFADDYECWLSDLKKNNTPHEGTYPRQKLSTMKPESVIGLPLVVRGPFGYAALFEANVSEGPCAHFCAGSVLASGASRSVAVRLTPRRDGQGCALGTFPAMSPWRVILLGDSAVDLVNRSDLVLNLNPPSKIAETSWIRPGVTGWDWWTARNSDLSTEAFKQKVDFAVEMGWPYTTLDAPWYGPHSLTKNAHDIDISTGSDRLNLDEALRYAKEKKIGVFLWLHVNDLNEYGVEKAFDYFAQKGGTGLKIDFLDHDDQEMVDWVNKTLAAAAERKLLINFHGMYHPSGTVRTWPNLITQEGILGNEFNKFGKSITPTHTVTLPYTRFLLGPGDFTPGGFLNVHPENFQPQNEGISPPCLEMGTRAHALALCVLYDSPLMTLCDHPDHYRNQPGLELLRNLPTVWDESRAICGEIGESFVEARRSGDVWYLSAITNESARTLDVSLDFLPPDTEWTAQIFADASESDHDATALSISEKTVHAGETLTLSMVRDGGWNAILRERKEGTL